MKKLCCIACAVFCALCLSLPACAAAGGAACIELAEKSLTALHTPAFAAVYKAFNSGTVKIFVASALAVVILAVIYIILRRRQSRRLALIKDRYDRMNRARDKRLSEIVMHEYDYSVTIDLDTLHYTGENLSESDGKFQFSGSGDYGEEFARFCKEQADPSDLDALMAYHSPDGLRYESTNIHHEPPSVLYRVNSEGKLQWMRSSIYFAKVDGTKYAYIFSKDVTKEIAARRALWQAEREKEQRLADLQTMRDSLQDALAEAERASRAKGQFLSLVSHEIRTPLNAIIGYMSIAEASPQDPARRWDCLQKSKSAARHLLAILNDVLDMASIESGKTRISSELFSLKQLVGGVEEMYLPQTKDKGIELEVDYDERAEDMLLGDSLRVSQILQNFLSNSLKFTPQGGRITLVVRQKTRQNGIVYIHFEVSDTGVGMDEEFMQRLFKPFERADSTSKQCSGTGLGLAITKNLVTMMKGSISAKSEPGRGTTMYVDIPFEEPEALSRAAQEPSAAEEKKPEPGFSGKRILLVEDNEMNMDIAT